MTVDTEIFIGNQGRNFVAIRVGRYGIEDWANVRMELQCDGWKCNFKEYLMKGELGRPAKELQRLRGDLRVTRRN